MLKVKNITNNNIIKYNALCYNLNFFKKRNALFFRKREIKVISLDETCLIRINTMKEFQQSSKYYV